MADGQMQARKNALAVPAGVHTIADIAEVMVNGLLICNAFIATIAAAQIRNLSHTITLKAKKVMYVHAANRERQNNDFKSY